MKWIYKIISNAYDKKIDGRGLAIFRIVYSIILFCEISHFFYFRHLIFDPIPYLESSEIDYTIPLLVWLLSIIFVSFGLFTRFSAGISYLMSVFFIGTIHTFEYHMDYVYLMTNFLLIFLPVSKCLSLDRLLEKYKYSSPKFIHEPDNKVSQLSYYAFILLPVGLVYFDSIFHKLGSDFWLQGLGVWLPASIPQTTYLDLSFILNSYWLVVIGSWLTLIIEATLIFLFWHKKIRLFYLFVGLILHIGILFAFPIPWFALGMTSFYILLVPVSVFKRKKQVFKRTPKINVYYDSESPLSVRTKIIFEYFDTKQKIYFAPIQEQNLENNLLEGYSESELFERFISTSVDGSDIKEGVDTFIRLLSCIWFLFPLSILLRIPGIYHFAKYLYQLVSDNRYGKRCIEENYGYTPNLTKRNSDKIRVFKGATLGDIRKAFFSVMLVLFLFLQGMATFNSPVIRNGFRSLLGEQNTLLNVSQSFCYKFIHAIGKPFFGITQHGVFVKQHFEGYEHIIAIEYKGEHLPLILDDGQVGLYNTGRVWAKYSFRTNSPHIDQTRLEKSVEDFTAFWAYKNAVELDDVVFDIKVKKISPPTKWEKNFLRKQMANPWIDGGYVEWKDYKFSPNIKDIESL